MFPSPSKIKVYAAPLFNQEPNRFLFASIPARPANHQSTRNIYSPTSQYSQKISPSATNPSTPFPFTLSLEKKMWNLFQISCEIASLSHGCFDGTVSQKAAERRMSVLEGLYDTLREDVDFELETSWVKAGFDLADLPSYPPSSKALGTTSIRPAIPKTGIVARDLGTSPTLPIKSDLKRKQETKARHGGANKKAKTKPKLAPLQTYNGSEGSNSDASSEVMALPASPIGLRTCMVPLDAKEKKRMQMFRWTGPRMRKGKHGLGEECISPGDVTSRVW